MSRWYDSEAEKIGGRSLDPFWRTRCGKAVLLSVFLVSMAVASVLRMRFACSAGTVRRGRSMGDRVGSPEQATPIESAKENGRPGSVEGFLVENSHAQGCGVTWAWHAHSRHRVGGVAIDVKHPLFRGDQLRTKCDAAPLAKEGVIQRWTMPRPQRHR